MKETKGYKFFPQTKNHNTPQTTFKERILKTKSSPLKWDYKLKTAGQILLATYMLLLSFTLIIMITNIDNFTYNILTEEQEKANNISLSLTGEKTYNYDSQGYRYVSQKEWDKASYKVKKNITIQIILLILMIIFNPDAMKKLKEAIIK